MNYFKTFLIHRDFTPLKWTLVFCWTFLGSEASCCDLCLERWGSAPTQGLQGQGNRGQKEKSWSAGRWDLNPCLLHKVRVKNPCPFPLSSDSSSPFTHNNLKVSMEVGILVIAGVISGQITGERWCWVNFYCWALQTCPGGDAAACAGCVLCLLPGTESLQVVLISHSIRAFGAFA